MIVAETSGALVVVVLVLAALVLLEALVLVEMIKQVAQLRQRVDLDDEPEPLLLGAAVARPFPRPELLDGTNTEAVIVFLSTHCASCEEVAAAIPKATGDAAVAVRVVPIVEGHAQAEVDDFVAAAKLPRQDVVFDSNRALAQELGLRVRPAALIVRDGLVAEGAAIRNSRQLVKFMKLVAAENGSAATKRVGTGPQRIPISELREEK